MHLLLVLVKAYLNLKRPTHWRTCGIYAHNPFWDKEAIKNWKVPRIQGTSHCWEWLSIINNKNKTAEERNLSSSLDDYLAIAWALDEFGLAGQKFVL